MRLTVNDSIKTLEADISPLKQLSHIRSENRKKMHLEETFITSSINKLEDVCEINIACESSSLQQNACSN